VPDVSFSDWVASLAADTLTGPEKLPLLDGATSRHATAALLAAFAVDQLHQAAVITTVNDADELNVFQSDIEKIITAQNFFNWVIDKLEALPTETTIVDGDKLVFSDGGVLKQIDIATVRTFLNSTDVALGAQIAALTSATLADSDQYVLAQGSTALKTTFTAIAARVHSQFLAYTASLPSVVALDNSDTFYVNDGGIASKITASTIGTYIQNEVGAAIAAAPWSSYSALGAAANATDVFLLQRSATGRTATGANVATYVVGTQNSAASSGATVAGDSFLIFRSGTQYKTDVGSLSTYVLASAWSAASGSPVVTGDKIAIGRSGTTYSVTVDQLKTYVQTGVQSSVLDLTGLSSAVLASGSLLLIGDGTTPKKSTLADFETQLWTDYKSYVTNLSSVVTLANADTFYVIQSNTAKKIASSDIAAYAETAMWSKSVITPAAGDNFWMRRGTTSYRVDIGALASYLSTAVAGSINISTLTAATLGVLSDNDLFIIDDGAVNNNKKLTLGNLKSHVFSSLSTYVTGLTAAGSVAGTEELYSLNTGSPQKITVSTLWNQRYLTDAKAIKLDDFATPDDNTDLDATSSAHGLMPKLSNNARLFYRGDGVQATYASVTATPTAATGATAADAAALASTNTTFITSDSTLKGVKLPTGNAGDIMDVINTTAVSAKLYPATGGFMNNQSANLGVVIPASRGVRCFCSATNTWTVFEMYSKAANAS
jgi:hypothetical protein